MKPLARYAPSPPPFFFPSTQWLVQGRFTLISTKHEGTSGFLGGGTDHPGFLPPPTAMPTVPARESPAAVPHLSICPVLRTHSTSGTTMQIPAPLPWKLQQADLLTGGHHPPPACQGTLMMWYHPALSWAIPTCRADPSNLGPKVQFLVFLDTHLIY